MSKFTFTAAAVVALFVTGCNTPVVAPMTAGGALSAATEAHAAASFVPVTAGLDVTGPSGYRVMALSAWAKTDIHHIDLTLLKDNGTGTFAATGATKTVAGDDVAEAVSLGNLKMGTRYKVVARAYADADGTNAIDDIAEFGSDAHCSVIFTTSSVVTAAGVDSINDATHAVTIPVRLQDKTYAGNATAGSGLAVTNGGIVDTNSAESF